MNTKANEIFSFPNDGRTDAVDGQVAVRVGGGDRHAARIPLGVVNGPVALPVDEVQKRLHDLAESQVPDQQTAVVSGAEQHVRVVRMRLQHKRLAFVTPQLLVQRSCRGAKYITRNSIIK